MKYFLDAEFYEHDRSIDPISLALVAEDGRELYRVFGAFDWTKCPDQWLHKHVKPQLPPGGSRDLAGRSIWSTSQGIASDIRALVADDPKPEFWGWYSSYDWVVLCQTFGRMLDLPPNFPKFCRDLKQEVARYHGVFLPVQITSKHDALEDARWLRSAHAAFGASKAPLLGLVHQWQQARRAYDEAVETVPQPKNYHSLAQQFDVADKALLHATFSADKKESP